MGVFAWFSLPELTLTLPRGYLLAKNLFWGIASLIAGAGMLSGKSWAPPISSWGSVLFGIFTLTDILLLRSSTYAQQARTFNVTVTIGSVLLVLWVLRRPGVRSFFRRKAV